MFTVEGFDGGVSYTVVVDDPDPARSLMRPRWGRASGSARAMLTLQLHEGQTAMVTPVGPGFEVNPDDAGSILAALYAFTQVTRVSGDAPVLLDQTAEYGTVN